MLFLSRSRRFRSLGVPVFTSALLLAMAWQTAAAGEIAVQLPGDPAIATLISTREALLMLTNADRAAQGLAPLDLDPRTDSSPAGTDN